MDYAEYQYLYPPRPEGKIPQGMLSFYEKRGYQAQIKKNGTCTVIFARGLEVIFKTRHQDDHKMWSPLPDHVRLFQSSSTKWNVYVAELLHSKTPHIKNHLFLFDQIVKDGVQLVGKTFTERQVILRNNWPNAVEQNDCYYVNQHLSIARNFDRGFAQIFKLLKPEDEGLVLKKPDAKLISCFKADSNSGWQVKCRVGHKNYSF